MRKVKRPALAAAAAGSQLVHSFWAGMKHTSPPVHYSDYPSDMSAASLSFCDVRAQVHALHQKAGRALAGGRSACQLPSDDRHQLATSTC
eukprot:SM000048S16525  [mRNA]  locus=s48:127968:128528:- [translate_table: standard]